MKTAIRMKRIVATVLTIVTLVTLMPCAFAIDTSFFDSHTDWHFDLSKSPDEEMTVEEFIALSTSYSYWSTGTNSGVTPTDKNGNQPSDWAAPYIRAENGKGTITPSEIDYRAKATLAFAMEFFCRCKGLYSFNAVNLRSFKGTEGLSTDQILYLCTAVDYGIFSYSNDMDVSVTLKRGDLEKRYLIPNGNYASKTPAVQNVASGYKYSTAFWEINAASEDPNEKAFQEKQLDVLKNNLDNFNNLYMNVVTLEDIGEGGEFKYLRDRIGTFDAHGEALKLCKENGIKVFGSILNYYDAAVLDKMKADDAVVEAVAAEMVALMEKHNLDGLNIDLEMGASDGTVYREVFSKLLKCLSPIVHKKGKLLSVTVGAYMQDKAEKNSLYDYSVIRETVDIANIINYDDHSADQYNFGGSMGAVSNYTYMQRCLRYAATAIGAEKVTLSIATFGVDYNTDLHLAINVSSDKVKSLISKYNATPKTSGADVDDAYFSYVNEDVNHTVYYESDSGIANRIGLAGRYGLGGVCCWMIGWKNTVAFNRMGVGLHGAQFVDVGANEVYFDAVIWAARAGITTGVDKTHFEPKEPCNRGQVVTFLWRAAGCPAPKGTDNPFVDVKNEGNCKPYYEAILWAAENGITLGVDKTHFNPGSTVTRAQFVTFLYRYEGSPKTMGSIQGFKDADHIAKPYQAAVAWAVANRVTTGYADNTFRPNDVCTRWAVVLFMHRDMA